MLVFGVTTGDPLEYVYVIAPDGMSVKLCPLQMLPLFTVIDGRGFRVTVTMVDPELTQPTLLVPETAYVDVVTGVTTGEPLE